MSKVDRYWRQVKAIEQMTGASSAIARRAVTQLRDQREWTTAAETKRHPIVVQRIVTELQQESKEPYRDLDDFIDSFESWDGGYEYWDAETSADY